MRIAYFTDTFLPEVNGVTNTLKQLSSYLCEKKTEHIFFAPDYDENGINTLKSKVVRFKSIKSTLYPECRLTFPLYKLHKHKIQEFNPNLIHITTPLGIGHLGLKYAKEYGIPVVMSYHTNFDRYLKFYNLEIFENMIWNYLKWFYEKSVYTLCPSNNTAQDLNNRGFKNLGVWSRGVDTDVFNAKNKNIQLRERLGANKKMLFLYVGRMAAEKDLDTLIESIKLVNIQYENEVGFVFTGDGPYMDTIKSFNIPNIILTGAKHGKELSEVYASCDAFVFPSGTETFGNVLLEAMASGLPSICVNSGGVLDFAKNKVNSLICESRNEMSIANGIIRLIEDKTLRDKLSRGGLLTANEKSWNSVFNCLVHNYMKVVVNIENIAV